jgi:sugar lactone lactonase YvrE
MPSFGAGVWFTALTAILLHFLFLSCEHPVLQNIHFEPFSPPPAQPLPPNNRLSTTRFLGQESGLIHGPETVAVDETGDGPEGVGRGDLYTATQDGHIVRFHVQNQTVEKWVNLRGRPLGLKFDPTTDSLIVADSLKGLLSVDRSTKDIRILSHVANDGSPINYADDVDIAKDGTIYFSDATALPPLQRADGTWDILKPSVLNILSAHPTGRLLRYSRDRGTEVLVKDLLFANGVALTRDESFVLVAESGKYRVIRYWLKGPKAGTSDVFVDNLPSFPDGVSLRGDGSGHFWVALVAPRDTLVDFAHPYPLLKKAMAALPDSLKPKPGTHAHIIECNEEGQIVQSLQGQLHGITAVTEYNGNLYLGSLHAHSIMQYTLSN